MTIGRAILIAFGAAFFLGAVNSLLNQYVALPLQDWSWVREWERTRWLPPGWKPEHRITCIGIRSADNRRAFVCRQERECSARGAE